MNFHIVGVDPIIAFQYVLSLYDDKSAEDKIKLLKNNRKLPNPSSSNPPKQFSSGNTMDLNASELLGIGLVGTYHNWAGENRGDTYQAVIGKEDSLKAQAENLLSDGAIWHDQSKKKMIYQQAQVQGYAPKRIPLSSEDIIREINRKINLRPNYPDNCGLIINVFSEEGDLDFDKIRQETDLRSYSQAFIIWYRMPVLDVARVYLVSNPKAAYLDVALSRRSHTEDWQFAYDDAKHYGTSG